MARSNNTIRLLGLRVQSRMLVLVAAVAGHAMNHIFLSGSLLILPELKAALGISNTGVGLIAATRDIFSGLISFPTGFVADRFAGKLAAILGVSVLGLGVCMFLVGVSTTFWMALVSITLLGMVIVLWHPPALATVSGQYPDRRGFAIGMHGMGGSIGEAVGPALLGFLLGFMLWRTVLQFSIIPALLMGIGIYLLVRAAPALANEATARGYFAAVRSVLRNTRLLLVLGTAACFSGTQIAITSFLPIYAREDLGLSPTATGAMLSFLQIAGIGSQPVLGYLSDRVGRRLVLALGLLGLTLGTLALYVSGEGGVLPRRWPDGPLPVPDDGHHPRLGDGHCRECRSGHDCVHHLRRRHRSRCRVPVDCRPRRRHLRRGRRLPVRGRPREPRLPLHRARRTTSRPPRSVGATSWLPWLSPRFN